MRIFHLSDLHIGLRLYHYDLKEEQEYLFREIVDKAVSYQPDVMVIAGDIYDKAVPSAEAVRIFNEFISSLTSKCPDLVVMMISGNHDSAERIDCFRSVLCRQNVYMVGVPPKTPEEKIEKVVVKDDYGDVNFYLLPFVKPAFVRGVFEEEITSYDEAVKKLLDREAIDKSQRNVIVSHQYYINGGSELERMKSEIVTVGNIDSVSADYLKPFEYAALGHLHKPMKVGNDNIRYVGTPMQYSVDEAGQEKGIILVTLKEKGKPVETEVIPLKSLRYVKKLKGRLDEILMQPSDDFITVTLTDADDLDTLDMQERLRQAFPYLLEIRREQSLSVNYGEMENMVMKDANPYDMFCRFFETISDEEKQILKDVINTVKEGEK